MESLRCFMLQRPVTLAAVSFAAVFAATGNVSAQALDDVQTDPAPLVLEAQGSFFVGGKKVEQTRGELGDLGPGGHITVHQMYVRFMAPQGGGGNPPVVMIHGATLTGKTWETTPDGRMGWDEYFVRKGHAVYVPDQVGRGRSGFDQAIYNNVRAGAVAPANQPPWLRFSDEGVWPNFRFGEKPGVAFPDSQFPVTAVDELAKQAVPDMNRGLPTPTPTIKALSDLATQLKGAVLIGHSQSGSFPLEAALLDPSVTKGLVLIEPGSCPASYTDRQIETLATVPLLVVFGDHRENPTGLSALPSWQARFEGCQALIARLKAAGGRASMFDPTERGIRGNSHMIMQDKNSLQIADQILSWLEQHVSEHSAPAAKPESLSDKQVGLVTIAAFTAKGDLARLKAAFNEALNAGLTINQIKEVLVQMYAYAGFPRSLNGIDTFEGVLQQRRQQGKNDVVGQAPNPLPANKTSLELGDQIRTRLTGSRAVAGYARSVPIIDDFLKAHLFGDIFGRDNLDYQSREIATIAALASLPGLQAQLRGHFNVGLNVGLSETQLRGILSVVSARVDKGQAEKASRLLDETLRTRAEPRAASSSDSSAAPGPASADAASADRLIVTSPGAQARAAPESNFTGSVSVASPFRATGTARLGGATVTFQPGARTHWHIHPLGQLLVVTEGEGWVQVEGEPVRVIKLGDVVWTAPGTKHWHGATPASTMTHVAVAESVEGGAVQWLESVDSRQYRAP